MDNTADDEERIGFLKRRMVDLRAEFECARFERNAGVINLSQEVRQLRAIVAETRSVTAEYHGLVTSVSDVRRRRSRRWGTREGAPEPQGALRWPCHP